MGICGTKYKCYKEVFRKKTVKFAVDAIRYMREGFMNNIWNKEIIKQLSSWLTINRTTKLLVDLSNKPSPSQISSYTRGDLISKKLKKWGVLKKSKVIWDSNYKKLGNGILEIGEKNEKDIGFFAHWDTISFIIGEKINSFKYRLIPYHNHLMETGEQKGGVIAYSLEKNEYEIISSGRIIGGKIPEYWADEEIELKSGHRVFYNTKTQDKGDNLYSGQFDDSAGCAGILLASAFLALFTDVELLTGFTDEEEGKVAKGNTAFSRGSRRIIENKAIPKINFVSDMHLLSDNDSGPNIGDGALFIEYASATRGAVTPPHLYEIVKMLSKSMSPNVKLNENKYGKVSRSDCIQILKKTPNIILTGVAATSPHYINGIPVCSAYDVNQLAKSLVLMALWFSNN